ncbi:inositol 2-dehydrogenase [Amycolatopsis echigonensis]|uniref:Inositol 2-dehydrogenase n=1 Tax=Amycolatopsis echigonensis TaxID=2576905 RepID=A0A8E1W6T1_9PSEU|nr:inositol 2-dehydrogenase [Amycolatopsis echigonensis]MBB2504891.1 inositol 2-dehydrogenase [Amycolatopsis echigonensis]
MLRVALFGSGRIGQVHARSIAAHPDAELAWICDPVQPAAEALAARHGGRVTAEPDEVFADPALDAVVIASPTPTHVDLLGRAAAAGKPVLCEKPIDLDLARIDRCWDDIAALQPFVMMGFNRRFDPTFTQLRQRVAAGEIGTFRALRITSRDPEPPPTAYLAASGGIFRDMTIHDFDLARFFLGEVTEVHAFASDDGNPVIAEARDAHQAMVLLRGANGALCTITNSRSCTFGYDQRVEAFGDNGMLEAANQSASSVRAYGTRGAETADPYLRFFVERYREAYLAEFDEFVRAVRENRPPSPDFADGRAALVLAEAALESVSTGRSVTVPAGPRPETEAPLANGAAR